MAKRTVPLPVRYAFLLVELAILLLANRAAFGVWIPATEPSGLWFYAALFGLLLGQRLDTPFFTAPKDAVLYAIPSLVAALQVPAAAWAASNRWGNDARTLLVGWIALVLLASSIAVWFHGTRGHVGSRLGAAAMQTSGALGNPQAFFSVILFLVLLAFPPETPEGVLALAAAWAVTVPMSLLDYLYAVWRRVKISLTKGSAGETAEVASIQFPGLFTLRADRQDTIPIGAVLALRDTAGDARLAVALARAGQDNGVLTQAVDLGGVQASQLTPGLDVVGAMEALVLSEEALSDEQKARADDFRSQCIGFVGPDTEIGRLIVEVTSQMDLAAGRLVRTTSGADEVFYQLTNGLTKEEIVQQRSTRGFVAAHAKSVGVWDDTEARFRPTTWVPSPNAPVMVVQPAVERFRVEQVGTFPGTDFGVRLKNIHQLVTHNTAILGILGVGKSTLALELVERVLNVGSKVLVLDLTDQYASELQGLFGEQYGKDLFDKLQAVGVAGKQNVKKNVEEGGSRQAFAQLMETELAGFMASDQSLLILNPAAFEVWRQDSKPFQDNASMASLTACEIAHIVSDAALRVVQKLGRTDSARLCLVYEEAHSLVPEWNAAVSEGDRAATNGSARAILQGRKYGLGCLLITQRTASVTKTILNQCNSVFAMRSFDDTSREFLSNYIGREYAALLPNLPERHAVLFGRASSCENPVHIQLNDRARFTAAFRAP